MGETIWRVAHDMGIGHGDTQRKDAGAFSHLTFTQIFRLLKHLVFYSERSKAAIGNCEGIEPLDSQ